MAFLAKTVVSAAVILFLLNKIQPSKILSAYKAFPISSMYAPVILYLLLGLWTSIKWKMLLPDIRFGPLLRVSLVRYFYSLIALGAVTGDVARAYLLGKGKKDGFAVITASVIVDRITGFIGLMLTGVIGMLASSTQIPSPLLPLCLSTILIGILAVFSLRNNSMHGFVVKLVRITLEKAGPLKRFIEPLARGLEALHRYAGQSKLMVLSMAAGIFSQVLCIASMALLARGLGLNVAMWDWCWIFCVVSMTVLVPISISGLGIREGSFVALLALFGVGAEKAMALSLLVFSLDIVLGAVGWLCKPRFTRAA